MSQTQVLVVSCDVDDKPVKIEEGAEYAPHTFSFDGQDYEIDLCSADAKKFAAAFAEAVQHARKVVPTKAGKGHRRNADRRARSKAIRAWAIEKGLIPSDSKAGRMPKSVEDQYIAEVETK